MKILVPIKRVPDPDYRVRIRPDGRGVEPEDLVQVANPFDLVAAEAALRIREGLAGVELAAVGIGRAEDVGGVRAGLALGLERGLFVETDAPPDPWNVARILHAVVERERPDLVLMGKQAIDDDAGQVGPFLAALLGWPQATSALKLVIACGAAEVERAVDAGRESLTVTLPAVVTVDLRMHAPRFPSLPSLLVAARAPVEVLAPAALGVAVEPRCEVLSLELPPSSRRCEVLADVDELTRRLRDREVI